MIFETRSDPFSTLLPENWRHSLLSLESQTQKEIDRFYRKHPLVRRIAFISMHLFRAITMAALSAWLSSWSRTLNFSVCAIGTFAYRFTAEPPCTMRFALSALEGQLSLTSALWGTARLIRGIAWHSFKNTALTTLSFAPAAGWFAGIVILSGKLEPLEEPCCHSSRSFV